MLISLLPVKTPYSIMSLLRLNSNIYSRVTQTLTLKLIIKSIFYADSIVKIYLLGMLESGHPPNEI